MPILSFRCKRTEAMFHGERARQFASIEDAAMRKLAMLNRAATLDDLRVPPANRLEALKDDRKGQHSIRINDQFRVALSGPATARRTWRSSTITRP